MASEEQQRFDDQVLIQYLLGGLSEEEAERLDELSVVDDAFAWQLSAVEDDLVDAYARGELSGHDMAQFKAFYLASPERLRKVEFAEALRSFDARSATSAAGAAPATAAPSAILQKDSSGSSSRHRLLTPSLTLQWGFACGVLILVLGGIYLLHENVRLRKQMTGLEGSHAAADVREHELQQQLNDQRAASADMARQLDGLRGSQPNFDQLTIVATLLPPPTRGPGHIPTVTVPSGTSFVVLLLALETDDFPVYRVELKDPATNQTLWRSANLGASPAGANRAVSVSFPARLLRQQNYVLELSGVTATGPVEDIAAYPVRVVMR